MENRKITEIKDRESWLQMRSKNISSTESSTLYNLNKYQTKLELYLDKKTSEIYEIEESDRMMLGNLMESSIAEFTAKKLNLNIKEFNKYIEIEDIKMGSSFDYEITDGEYKGWILEIKMVDYIIYKNEWDEDEAPAHIEVQVQHQMEAADRPGCIIACLVGGNDLKTIYRKRNRKVGQAIKNKISKFWKDVDEGNQPDADYLRDYELISAMNPCTSEEYESLDIDDECTQWILQYEDSRILEKEIKESKASLKAKIIERVGNKSGAYIKDKDNDRVIKMHCKISKDTPGKVITEEMVGETIGFRKGSRRFSVKISQY